MPISIIMPIYILDEELADTTYRCVASLRANTKKRVELIIIDNNSPVKIDIECDRYIRSAKNYGNAWAWNIGAEVAKYKNMLFSDNDVLFNEGWEIMKENLDNSIVFPQSFSREQGYYTNKIAGFFWMINKKTFNKIGKISEEFGLANFEDTDYFMRAMKMGVELKVVQAAKIWHYGRATCDKVPEVRPLFDINEKKYNKMWDSKYPYITKVI